MKQGWGKRTRAATWNTRSLARDSCQPQRHRHCRRHRHRRRRRHNQQNCCHYHISLKATLAATNEMISSSSKHLICSCLGRSLLTTMTRVMRRLMTKMMMMVSSRRMTNTTTMMMMRLRMMINTTIMTMMVSSRRITNTTTMMMMLLRMMIITTGVLLPHLVGGPWLCGNAPLPNVPHRMLRACTQTSMETLVHKLAKHTHTCTHQLPPKHLHIHLHTHTCTAQSLLFVATSTLTITECNRKSIISSAHPPAKDSRAYKYFCLGECSTCTPTSRAVCSRALLPGRMFRP